MSLRRARQSSFANYTALTSVHVGRLRGKFITQLVKGADAPDLKALPCHCGQLIFGDTQPTGVIGGVNYLDTIPQRLGLSRRKGLLEHTRAMGVQIVHC